MLVPPTSVDVVSCDTGADVEEEITGGALASATTGTGILGIVCTFFATSLFTF
jgi:hypothetical protein